MNIPDEWTFECKSTAENFEAHVREQLPWYDLVTQAVAHIAKHYIPVGGLVYDIGASTGNIGNCISDTVTVRGAKLVAIESSQEMATMYRSIGELVIGDAVEFDYQEFDFCVLFLTLMFIEPRKRKELIAKLKSKMRDGGAIIIVDKSLPVGGYPSVIMSRLALSQKLHNGASPDDIIRKELSLSGVQRPISSSLIDDGTEFFRLGDFAGWIIESKV